ncbi:MAG: hypothetical protein Alpg2KO_23120 [Alphaproteobacteria bacterium]
MRARSAVEWEGGMGVVDMAAGSIRQDSSASILRHALQASLFRYRNHMQVLSDAVSHRPLVSVGASSYMGKGKGRRCKLAAPIIFLLPKPRKGADRNE